MRRVGGLESVSCNCNTKGKNHIKQNKHEWAVPQCANSLCFNVFGDFWVEVYVELDQLSLRNSNQLFALLRNQMDKIG